MSIDQQIALLRAKDALADAHAALCEAEPECHRALAECDCSVADLYHQAKTRLRVSGVMERT